MSSIAGFMNSLREKGNYPVALAYLEDLLKRDPLNIDAIYHYAICVADLGDLEKSLEILKQVLEIDPHHKDSLFDLGAILSHLGKWEDAVKAANRLIEIDPSWRRILMHSANLLSNMGRREEALERYEKECELRPGEITPWSDLLLSLNYIEMSREERYSYSKRLYESLEKRDAPRVKKEDKIKIAYVSSDFRNHAVSYFLKSVLPHHDRERFDVIFYHNSQVRDEITGLYEKSGDLVQCYGVSDEELFKEIQERGVEILVDLNGHTRDNRLSLFLMRPCPVQIAWMGFSNTLAIPGIDHKIIHPGILPEDAQQFYFEKIHRVNGTLTYTPPEGAPLPSRQPFLERGYITYGCFNNTRKISETTLKTWDRILTESSESRLELLSSGDPSFDTGVLMNFNESNRNRIHFNPERGTLEFMSLLSSVDVFLDTFPHGGGATTAHALWMGVPIITLEGENEYGRFSSSLLREIGIQEYIATSLEEYVRISLSLNRDSLVELRSSLRNLMGKNDLSGVRNIEKLYEDLIVEYRETQTA